MGEDTLIAAAKKGEIAAFNQLVRTYQELAYNLAYRVLGDPDLAADACQEAFLSAFKAIRGFRGNSFKAWLLRIVINACYDQLRSRRRRPTESLDSDIEDPEHAPTMTDPRSSPEDQVMAHELERAIHAGLQTLPQDQRITLILIDVQGFNYVEAAEITRSSLGTVKSRLSRARARLRDYLLQCGELLPDKYRHQT